MPHDQSFRPPDAPSSRRRFLRLRRWLRPAGGGAGTALILLGFILLPSILLGLLGWEAIRNEKTHSLERLQASYRQSVTLAARQLDLQLYLLEGRWNAAFQRVITAAHERPLAEALGAAENLEPLIEEYFLLDAHGRVLYPPDLGGARSQEGAVIAAQRESPEYERFVNMIARGEELEYSLADLPGALAVYRELVRELTSPRLQAVAISHEGRVQLKAGNAAEALATYRRLLSRHAEARDLDRMYLRFLAQYQIATCLRLLWRPTEALDVLVALHKDLLDRSDAITALQFSYYHDLVSTLSSRLLDAVSPAERARYEAEFATLGERGKKRINEKYFLELLGAELSELSLRQKRYTPGIRYMTARAEGPPFVLVYRVMLDARGSHPAGILAAQLDLQQLQRSLFSALDGLDLDPHGAMALLGPAGNVLIGAEATEGTFMAAQTLAPPFETMQVAVYLQDVPTAIRRLDLGNTVALWLISLMLLSVLLGGYFFIVRARRQAFVARAQTTFVSNVTHELRTPLASIRMFAELLELDLEKDGDGGPHRSGTDMARHLRIIRQECDRLTRLIDRVLDFSRTEQQTRRYRFADQDVGTVVSAAVESFRPGAEARGFTLQLSLEESLPRLRIDEDAMAQVMWNLLTNAVQFSPDRKEIRVRVARSEPGVTIEVADRGVGIEPRDLRRIFDRFYSSWRRMDDRTQGGLGLGLTLSREIVRQHGGEITVTSEIGKGSTFAVTLPSSPAGAQGVVEIPRGARQQDGGTVRLEAHGG